MARDDLDLDDGREEEALVVVPTEGRGSMPFALLQGESLVAVASWAAGDAGLELLDFTASWDQVVSRGLPLLVHDPLCPGTPGEFLLEAVRRAGETGSVVLGVRPGVDGKDAPASPVVLPAVVVAALPGWPDLTDLAGLVDRLGDLAPVEVLLAPEQARRVRSEEDVAALARTLAEQDQDA